MLVVHLNLIWIRYYYCSQVSSLPLGHHLAVLSVTTLCTNGMDQQALCLKIPFSQRHRIRPTVHTRTHTGNTSHIHIICLCPGQMLIFMLNEHSMGIVCREPQLYYLTIKISFFPPPIEFSLFIHIYSSCTVWMWMWNIYI